MSLLQMFTATPAAPFAWSLVLSGGSVVASILPLGAARSLNQLAEIQNIMLWLRQSGDRNSVSPGQVVCDESSHKNLPGVSLVLLSFFS